MPVTTTLIDWCECCGDQVGPGPAKPCSDCIPSKVESVALDISGIAGPFVQGTQACYTNNANRLYLLNRVPGDTQGNCEIILGDANDRDNAGILLWTDRLFASPNSTCTTGRYEFEGYLNRITASVTCCSGCFLSPATKPPGAEHIVLVSPFASTVTFIRCIDNAGTPIGPWQRSVAIREMRLTLQFSN